MCKMNTLRKALISMQKGYFDDDYKYPSARTMAIFNTPSIQIFGCWTPPSCYRENEMMTVMIYHRKWAV